MKEFTELNTAYPNTVVIGLEDFKTFDVTREVRIYNSRSGRLMAIIPVSMIERFLYTAVIKSPRGKDAKDRYGSDQFYRLVIPKECEIKVTI